MILPFPRHLVAGVSQGSQVVSDGEIDLPPSLFPFAIVGTPIDETQIPPIGQVMNQSFLGGRNNNASGIAIAASNDLETFGKGLWYIDGAFVFQFTGTTNAANQTLLTLSDKNGVARSVWAEAMHITGSFLTIYFQRWLSLRVDGCRLTLARPATVAGDNIMTSFRYSATKVL